jgi:hypothetical protein
VDKHDGPIAELGIAVRREPEQLFVDENLNLAARVGHRATYENVIMTRPLAAFGVQSRFWRRRERRPKNNAVRVT